jgi:cytochrome c oxidase cbb3-type subunit 3
MIESLFGGSNDTINILGGIGFFAVVGITAWVVYVYAKQIKDSKSEGELAEENWDGIGEYKNPLPTGWAVIFAGLIVWAAWYYLAGYPLNGYSQVGEWNQENKEYKAEFVSTWANASEDELRGMGESIFLAKCAPCHGNTGEGMDGKAQDLTEPTYKYYGVEGLVAAIKFGKQGEIGVMPSFEKEGTLTELQYKAVANYIISITR